MKQSFRLFLFLTSLFLISCTREDDTSFSIGFDAPVVHGIVGTNIYGEFQGNLGYPNIRVHDSRLKSDNGQLSERSRRARKISSPGRID